MLVRIQILLLALTPFIDTDGKLSSGKDGTFTCMDQSNPPDSSTGLNYTAFCDLAGSDNPDVVNISSGQFIVTDYTDNALSVHYDLTLPDRTKLVGSAQASFCQSLSLNK
jgi:hypothetical protein